MLSRRVRVAVSAFCITTLLAAIAPAAHAATPDRKFCRTCKVEEQVGTGAGGGTLEAGLEMFGEQTGGSSYRRVASVPVVPRCWYRWWFTGAEYAAQWTNQDYQQALAQMPPQYRTQPLPGWQEHQLKGADEGGWYGPWCREGVDGAFVLAYGDAHPPRFFPVGEAPDPAQDVEPRILAEAAYKAMDLPRGTVRWNPSLQGSGATLVNEDTWVWVEDAARTATIRATLPSGPWVQVDAVIQSVTVSAPGADPTRCTDLGVAWSPAQDAAGTTCSVVFERSSANQQVKPGQDLPTATMEVTTVWSASWTSWLDATPVPLGTQSTTVTAEVPVAEVQSVVF